MKKANNIVTKDMLKKALKDKVITIELKDNLPELIDRKDKYSRRMIKLNMYINKKIYKDLEYLGMMNN